MYMDEELRVICIVGVILCVILAGIIYCAYRVERHNCYVRYKQFDPEYVGWVTGCMVTADDQRIPASALRITM